MVAGRLLEDSFLARPMDALHSRSHAIEEVRKLEIPHQVILIFEGPDQLEGLCWRILESYESLATPREDFEHRERIARSLMERDRSLPFGIALERVKLCLPAVQAKMAEELRQAVQADESKPRTMLIMGDQASYVD